MLKVDNVPLSTFYQSIIENAESNVLILNTDFSIVTMNPGFYWVFLEAYDIHIKKGEKLFDLMAAVAPEISDRWRLRCHTALKGMAISDEEEFETKNTRFYWKMYYKSVEHDNQQFISIVSRNVTPHRLAQNKVLTHEANLRSLINSVNFSLILLDSQLNLIDFNDQTFDFFLRTYNVFLLPSKNFIDLFPKTVPDLRERWHDRLTTALERKKVFRYTDHFNGVDQTITFETRICLAILPDGNTGLSVMIEDVN